MLPLPQHSKELKKAIWLVSGGPMQFHLAKRILQLGYALIVSDGKEDAFCRSLADAFVHADTFDIDTHKKAVKELQHEFDIVAAINVASDCHETVNEIRITLGHNHHSRWVSKVCRRKSEQRQFFSEKGFLQPTSFATSTFRDAKRSARLIGGSFVVKADDSSGSRGFSLFESVDEFHLDDFNRARRESSTKTVIIEEALAPDSSRDLPAELSVESIWIDGNFHPLNAVDRFFPRDSELIGGLLNFQVQASAGVEIGHLNPSLRGATEIQELFQILKKAGVALGFDQCEGVFPLKADFFLSAKGPIILEITPRLSGGWDSSASSLCRGADFQYAQLLLTIDKEAFREEALKLMRFEEGIANFAFVLGVPPEGAKDNIGRTFFIGVGSSPHEAASQAAHNKKRGQTVMRELSALLALRGETPE